jgi:TetR/AcrR family transcriptional repressor of nem operon
MNYRHNKVKVINKGMKLFWAKGYHNLGVDEICRETGMTKGAFYNSFKSKEQFLLTTIEHYGSFITEHLKKQLTNSRLKAFDRLLSVYREMLETQPKNNHIGCFVNNTMSELGALNASIASTASDQFHKFLNTIEPTVKEAQENQDLTNTIDSYLLTEIIHTTFFGVLTTSKSTKTSGFTIMKTFLQSLKQKTT